MTDSQVRNASSPSSPRPDDTSVDSEPFPIDEPQAQEPIGKLSELSDTEILARLDLLGGVRRRVDARVIAYLAEVEERRLHLEQAYSSLHDFCRRRLGMSDGEAYRRITAARLARRFPSIVARVAQGDIHLSALSLLRNHLTPENHEELLREASGRTIEGVKHLLAMRFPRPDVPSRIVSVSDELVPAASVGGSSPFVDPDFTRQIVEPISPGRYRVEFTVTTELRDKIVRGEELMCHSNPKGELAVMFERALDLLIAKLERKRFGKSSRPQEGGGAVTTGTQSRYVAANARREVHARDGEQCTFVAENGQRCPSRSFIQRDHVEPWARDGGNDALNLRHLCWGHNRLHAERKFGKAYIEEKIDQRRNSAAKSSPPRKSDGTVGNGEAHTLAVIFDTVARNLKSLGFAEEQTRAALEVVRQDTASPSVPTVQSVLSRALRILEVR